MQQAHISDDMRWFGLPGAFMAGIIAGALITAVGYAQYGHGSLGLDRYLDAWLTAGPALETQQSDIPDRPAANVRIAAQI